MLSSMQLIKYWLPGVAGTQPRLGPVLGGRLTKGGLHQPPFYLSKHFPQAYLSFLSCALSDSYHGLRLPKKMSRQWGHWRLGRGGWRALHWSSISRAFIPHFLAHRLLCRAQQRQNCAHRKNRQDHFNLQQRLPRTHSVSLLRASPSLARTVQFHRYSLLPRVPHALVPLYHRRR